MKFFVIIFTCFCALFHAAEENLTYLEYSQLLSKAEAGEVDAMVEVARCLISAVGVDQGYEEGKQWLLKATE